MFWPLKNIKGPFNRTQWTILCWGWMPIYGADFNWISTTPSPPPPRNPSNLVADDHLRRSSTPYLAPAPSDIRPMRLFHASARLQPWSSSQRGGGGFSGRCKEGHDTELLRGWRGGCALPDGPLGGHAETWGPIVVLHRSLDVVAWVGHARGHLPTCGPACSRCLVTWVGLAWVRVLAKSVAHEEQWSTVRPWWASPLTLSESR
jgi:hypothetical protein